MRRTSRTLPVCGWIRRCSDSFRLLLLLGLTGLLLTACPPAPPPLPPPSATRPPTAPRLSGVPQAHRQAYLRAETLRSQGQLRQAQQAFATFVHRYPFSPLADDALFALGQIATRRKDFHSASQAYQRLIDDFPDSEHVQLAYLELGTTLYHMGDYTRGQAALQHFLTLAAPPDRQATAHYYLGLIAREQQRYAAAVENLAQSLILSPDAVFAQQARREMTRIVQERLTLTELEQLAQRYPTSYPGSLLLLELARRHRAANNAFDEMATLQRFMTAFPEHPEVPAVQARLQELQEGVTTNATSIGLLLPLSGEGGPYGQNALKGIELALAVWQERYPDTPLSLVVRDSQGVSEVASEALRALVVAQQAIGVIGPLLTRVAESLVPIAEQLRIPLISPYAPGGDFPARSEYAFRSSLTDAVQARFLAEYAVYTLNLHRFAILYPNEPYGISLKDHFMAHLSQLQGEVVATAAYAPETTDFSAAIRRIGGVDDDTLRKLRSRPSAASANPIPHYDGIFLPGYYDKVKLIAPALAFFNITGAQLLGSDGWHAPEITAGSDDILEGAIFVDGFFVDSPLSRVQEFVARYQARYLELPDLFAAQAYDTFLMVAQVLRDGATTRSELRHGLLRIRNFEGASGTTTITAQGDAEKIPFVLTIRNGRIEQRY
jgi:branched-chain amino acid transport system substrate-binding protein